ncbi:MAG: hypothetical protein WC496_01665 [Phycisphaerae bacterium]|jgi:hypothetical protein
MKNLLALVMVSLVAFPVFALTVSFSDNGNHTVNLNYDATGDDELPRAFALNIQVSGGAMITSVTGFKIDGESTATSPGYGIFMGGIVIDGNGIVQDYSTPLDSSGSPGTVDQVLPSNHIILGMSSLYWPVDSEVNAPGASGTLCTLGIDCNGAAGDISIIATQEDIYRGGIVLEDSNSAEDVNFQTLVYSCAPATVFSDGFESNFDKWDDFGTTLWDRTTAQKKSGSYSAHCSVGQMSLYSDYIDTSECYSITVSFWYMDHGIDDNDNVYLEFLDNNGYYNETIFEIGNTSPEDTWHQYETTIYNSGSDTQYFHPTFNIRFKGSYIDAGEDLWIDDVSVVVRY